MNSIENNNTDLQLNFIVGIGRSGTSILTKLLNNYKGIHCLPEANFLLFFLYQYQDKKSFSKSEVDLLFEQIETYYLSHPWVGWEFNLEKAKTIIYSDLSKNLIISYEKLCLLIYKNFKLLEFDKSHANILIDKNPSYTLFINQIHKCFPTSKFIWIVRDYRANILSRKQSIYLKSSNVAFNATRWKLFNKAAFEFSKKYPHKILLIKYEDLVEQSNEVMNRIINFLDIQVSYESSPQDYKSNIDFIGATITNRYKDRFYKKYSDLNKPLNASRLYSWKEELTVDDIKKCEVICASFAEKFGYKELYKLGLINYLSILIMSMPSIIKGYIDIYKDKIIYYISVKIKLKRLKIKYKEFGFIKT